MQVYKSCLHAQFREPAWVVKLANFFWDPKMEHNNLNCQFSGNTIQQNLAANLFVSELF